MLRILLVHPTPTRGGFSAVVSQAHELSARGGFEVLVACSPGSRLDELPPSSAILPLNHQLSSLRGIWEFRKALLAARPDIIHFHGRKAGVLGRLVLKLSNSDFCILYTPHGTPWVGHSFLRGVAGDLAERMLLRTTASVLCVSHHEVEQWRWRDGSSRIKYFPNPVPALGDPDKMGPEVDGAHEWSNNILVPSGYHPQKRLEVVIEALALVDKPRPRVIFAGMVDNVEYRNYLQRFASQLGVQEDIRFCGNVLNIRPALREASLVILPSFSEGLPIIGQEAIAEGARVAWSHISAHAEIFGETGSPFSTAEDLAPIMASNHATASTMTRRPWLLSYQKNVDRLRAEYWDTLEEQMRHASR